MISVRMSYQSVTCLQKALPPWPYIRPDSALPQKLARRENNTCSVVKQLHQCTEYYKKLVWRRAVPWQAQNCEKFVLALCFLIGSSNISTAAGSLDSFHNSQGGHTGNGRQKAGFKGFTAAGQ